MADPFAVACAELDGQCLVRVRGEIDLATAPLLADVLDVCRGDVAVDLSDVTYLDSCGLRVLVTAHDRLRRRDASLMICAASPLVVRVLGLIAEPADDRSRRETLPVA